MSVILDACRLLPTFCLSKLYAAREEVKVRAAFYHHPTFRKADETLKEAYRDVSPYALSKQFLLQKGASNVHLYGETPLTTLYQIACHFGITPKDHVLELGSGRGRGINFLRHYIGCTVTGIEWHPLFVERTVQDDKCKVICADILEYPFHAATVIYFYGTSFEDAFIEKLCEKLSSLEKPIKIITVSYPLSDYSSDFATERSFIGSFPWGKGEIFLNRKKGYQEECLCLTNE